MERLTKRDWQIVNTALAFMEADDLSELAEMDGVTEDEFRDALKRAREKVWQRIPQEP